MNENEEATTEETSEGLESQDEVNEDENDDGA